MLSVEAGNDLGVDPSTPLLQVVRNCLGVTGTKYACGVASARPRSWRRVERLWALNAALAEPGWNMDQQIVNQTSYRWQHSPRRRINQMENILRPGPFRQDSFNEPLF